MNGIRRTTAAALIASFIGLSPALAMDDQGHNRRHRIEQEQRREERQERKARAEAAREYRTERQIAREQYQRQVARQQYWDAARYYRDDNRYQARRLTRSDWVYRGSDNRYYCRRDDGTTGLIIGGVSGAVLGNIIAPGGAKLLGTIIGGGAGAIIGKKVDEGDVVCR